MASGTYTTNIESYLFQYADLVSHSNSLNRNDRAIDSENLFCNILNTAFGWNLINSNEGKKNQANFDLEDKGRKLLVQVTTTKIHSKKRENTLAPYLKRGAKIKHKKLLLLFISRKCSPAVLKGGKKGKFEYQVFDIPALLSAIYFKCKSPDKLREINALLQTEISPVPIVIDKKATTAVSKRVSYTTATGIIINRKKIIEELFAFSQIANGLVVGGPGAGKSYSLEELQKFCNQKNLPCYIIRVNELIDGSDSEIKEVFNTTSNWIQYLNNQSFDSGKGKGILIFDAFDTAKESKLKSAILKQIKKAQEQLTENWHMLVSARTFDAQRSAQLLELFPEVNVLKPISCRYFPIPDLSEGEVKTALAWTASLLTIYNKSSAGLQKLLKTPYFLKLFERIYKEASAGKKAGVGTVETDDQLLEMFWKKRVLINSENDLFLRKLTQQLINNKNLSCRKDQIITEGNVAILDELISAGILVESSVSKQNISYAHNILLEYAVSVYLLSDDPDEMTGYIRDNQTMPFTFRQSFIYFYSRLWKLDDKLFWKHYFAARDIQTPLFRLFHQSILNYILVAFYSSGSDLDPIFANLDAQEKGLMLRKVLEAVRFINKGAVNNRDYDLFLASSKHASMQLVWELGWLIDNAIAELDKKPDAVNFKKIGAASRNYLTYILRERKNFINKELVERNGAHWGVHAVILTYDTNPTQSKKLLKESLSVLQEEDFSFRFVETFAEKIVHLFKSDPSFGLYIYRTLYFHTERSDKATHRGGVAINLISNRRQDFEGIHFQLEAHFREVAQIAPSEAIPLGIEIVNRFSADEGTSYYHKTLFKFTVNKIKAILAPDFTHYDSDDDDQNGPFSHAENIFLYLESVVKGNNKKLFTQLLKAIISNSKSSRLWKKLIKLIIKYPAQLKDTGTGLLANDVFFICTETVFEAGELITAMWRYLSATQKRNLEQRILNLKNLPKFIKYGGRPEYLTVRLLGCIPKNSLSYTESKKLIKNNAGIVNKPQSKAVLMQGYQETEEEIKVRMGVDPASKIESEIYGLIEKIKPFNDKYDHNNNDKPAVKEFSPLIPLVKKLWAYSKTIPDRERLLFNCDYEVSRFGKLIARNGAKLSKVNRQFAVSIGAEYINSDLYKEKEYQRGESKGKIVSYSPTPRTAAAQLFVGLVYSDTTGTMRPIIRELFYDNSRAIRLKAVTGLVNFWYKQRDEFWKILEDRVKVEEDGLTFQQLIRNVCFDNIIKYDTKHVEAVAIAALTNLLTRTDETISFEIWHQYVVLILKLLLVADSPVAEVLISSAVNNKSLDRALLLELLTLVDPHGKGHAYLKHPANHDKIYLLIKNILVKKYAVIQEKGYDSGLVSDEFEVIDFCIKQFHATIIRGQKANRALKVVRPNKAPFYQRIKPILRYVVDESMKTGSGFMVAHTGYYFMQLLNELLAFDTEFILQLSTDVVSCAAANNFTYDISTMREIVELTEHILADHKDVLAKPESFESLITILDHFANSGWQEPLELIWRLKEVF